MKYFSILRPMRNNVRFEYVPFRSLGYTFVIKLRNFDFEGHWNTLILFEQKRYNIRFQHVPWKNVCFWFISNIWVHFSHKTYKFWFWRSLKYFNVFWLKKWCLIWFKLCCLNRVLVMSWEIRILDFVKIVFFDSGIYCQIKICHGFFFLSYLYFLELL